jgi:hypothetical protein
MDNIDPLLLKFFIDRTPTDVVRGEKVILMCGLPGSGKTGTRKFCAGNLNHYCIIEIDECLKVLLNNDVSQYNKAWGYVLLWKKYCIENKYNTIYDSTGKDLFEIIKEFKNANYVVNLCINLISFDVARKRIIERKEKEGESGREISPKKYVDTVIKLLKKNIIKYLRNNNISNVIVYSNDSTEEHRQLLCSGKKECLSKYEKIHSYFVEKSETINKYVYTKK